jgi:hypothetical protein
MSQYVILNDDYLTSGYVDASYVGTDSDLYVESGYVRAGELKTASASISATATVSVDGVRTRKGTVLKVSSGTLSVSAGVIKAYSATLEHTFNEQTWADAGTWEKSRAEAWRPVVAVDGLRVAQGTGTFSSTITLDAQGRTTRNPSTLFVNLGTMSVNGEKTINAYPSVQSSEFTVDAQGFTGIQSGPITMSGVFTLPPFTPLGIRAGTATLSSAFTQTADADLTRRGTILQATLGDISIDGVRTRNTSATINSQATVSIAGKSIRQGTILSASLGDLDVSARLIRSLGTVELAAQATFFSMSTVIFGGTSTARAEFSLTGDLRVFKIDPYRIHNIDSETRIAEIAEELRLFGVNSETRVNTIEQEIRTYLVPSETRTLVIQPLVFVNIPGTSRNRRE